MTRVTLYEYSNGRYGPVPDDEAAPLLEGLTPEEALLKYSGTYLQAGVSGEGSDGVLARAKQMRDV